MYLTKLFVMLGVVLIASFDPTEGRRRWLNRIGENLGCAKHKKLNVVIGTIPDEDNINSVQEPRNDIEINKRRSNRWNRLKCGETKHIEEVSNPELIVNSSDSHINQHNNKVPINLRISRRTNCSGRKSKFNRVANSGASLNVTNNELPPSGNDEGLNLYRNRKCNERFAHRGKSESKANHEKTKESNENILNNTNSATVKEPILNVE